MSLSEGLYYLIAIKSDGTKYFVTRSESQEFFGFDIIDESKYPEFIKPAGYSSEFQLNICFWKSKGDAEKAISSIMVGGQSGLDYRKHSFVRFKINLLKF
ncbi:hypothetical protein VPHG_00158 [Vibrio phage 11895-B1]|uniref:hypothetical protein n=1 Tax=Vibrio phage 11895-B1 TaxID=754075 RepID=UPI0002C0A523|nr:hypothetical protein VPHG_00158 [Vibrio phage 11895-B1]AGH32222.1 hypothetical protein VPHG_00158 [Vibrio phage 11895-B1]